MGGGREGGERGEKRGERREEERRGGVAGVGGGGRSDTRLRWIKSRLG